MYTHTHKSPIFIAYVVFKIDTKLHNYVEEKSNLSKNTNLASNRF